MNSARSGTHRRMREGMPEWKPFDLANPEVMKLGDNEGPEPILPEDKVKLSEAWGDVGGTPHRDRAGPTPADIE